MSDPLFPCDTCGVSQRPSNLAKHARIHRPLRERIAERVVKEPNTGCWLWTGATIPQGYGSLSTGKSSRRAHRAAWEAWRGPIPRGLSVLHRCDTPPCVNPDHLWLGTQADNMRDAQQKGRLRHAR